MKVRILRKNDYKDMKRIFLDVFSNEPWFDKWNREQLDLYMKELTENNNSLSLALFDEKEELIGCSLGYIFNCGKVENILLRNFLFLEKIKVKVQVVFFLL